MSSLTDILMRELEDYEDVDHPTHIALATAIMGIEALEKDLAFYKSCALSGEIPLEGSEPSAAALEKKPTLGELHIYVKGVGSGEQQ